MFILELTLRSWAHAEDNRRRTLQRSDVAAAISKNEVFDFLVGHCCAWYVRPCSYMSCSFQGTKVSGYIRDVLMVQPPLPVAAVVVLFHIKCCRTMA